MDLAKLYLDLERDEGVRDRVYTDSVGVPTIGVGHNLHTPITPRAIRTILEDDVTATLADLDRSIPWWRTQPEPVQEVLVNMAFNLGIGGLLKFKQTLSALMRSDYPTAARGMLASKWAKQVGDRAKRLANQVRSVV